MEFKLSCNNFDKILAWIYVKKAFKIEENVKETEYKKSKCKKGFIQWNWYWWLKILINLAINYSF